MKNQNKSVLCTPRGIWTSLHFSIKMSTFYYIFEMIHLHFLSNITLKCIVPANKVTLVHEAFQKVIIGELYIAVIPDAY